MNEIVYNGVAEDPRSETEKGNDWKHSEAFGMGETKFQWRVKARESWKHYPIRNQDGSGMCGAFSTAKALGINEFNENNVFVNLNTAFIYNKRWNKGSAGMYMQDMFDIACNFGAPVDSKLISDGINDEQASKLTFTEAETKSALKYRGRYYFTLPNNIDTIASVVEAGYTPILLLACAFKEWTAEPWVDPTVKNADKTIAHFVPVVDVTLYNGKKCLIIEDSWGQQYGYEGVRILSEDFLTNRVYAIGYIIDLKNEDLDKPLHTFTTQLGYGATGSEVTAWQKVLQYEKFLPTHTVKGDPLPLGSFLEMTAKATKGWQIAHGLNDFANEKDMKKIRFGKKSIDVANSLYSK